MNDNADNKLPSIPDYFEIIDYEKYEKDIIENIKVVINNLISLEKTNSDHLNQIDCEFVFRDLHISIRKKKTTHYARTIQSQFSKLVAACKKVTE